MNNFDKAKLILKGTTSIGVKCVDGVILAADMRAVNQEFNIVSENVRKVFSLIDNRVGIALSGIVGDVQGLVDLMRAELKLYLLENEKISVRGIAQFIGNFLFRSIRRYPYIVEAIIGGYDDTGYHLYGLDMAGSIIEDNIIAIGEGATLVFGVLEAVDLSKLKVKEAKKVALDALKSASKRSAFTGSRIQMLFLSKSGSHEEVLEV
ncbi:MAG: proteasome subunit beta [Candidatus Asgardarchaeum sp.]|nr:proteasome subunit beta [Candidatus Odinarchaeota archaeon]